MNHMHGSHARRGALALAVHHLEERRVIEVENRAVRINRMELGAARDRLADGSDHEFRRRSIRGVRPEVGQKLWRFTPLNMIFRPLT